MTVTADSQPLVIRANPDRRIMAEAAVVVYESDGQTLLAQYLALHTPDAAFNVPLNVPNAAAFATCQTWIGLDGEFTRAETDRGPQTVRVTPGSENPVVLGITDIVVATDIELLSVQIPTIEADFKIESVRAFDLRQPDGSIPLPGWLQTATQQTQISRSNQFASLLEGRFDAAKKQLQVRLQKAAQTQESEQTANGLVFTTIEHRVRLSDSGLLTGESGFLTFSLRENQPVRITVPAETTATGITVDGKALPFTVKGNIISVAASQRVSFVAVTWMHEIPKHADAIAGSVRLPRILSAQTTVHTELSYRKAAGWSIANVLQDSAKLTIERLRSVTNGLQLIDSETPPDDAIAEAKLPMEFRTSPASPTWKQLASESPDATIAFGQFLMKSDDTRPDLVSVQTSQSEALRLKSPDTPSVITGLSLLFALAMFLTPVIGRSKQTPQPIGSEASTVVTAAASADESAALEASAEAEKPDEPSTILSVDPPE